VVALRRCGAVPFKGVDYGISVAGFRRGAFCPARFLEAAGGPMPLKLARFSVTPAVAVGVGATVNLAGCVLFGVSVIGSGVAPTTGSILDLPAAHWTTAFGARGFFVGALLLLSHRDTEVSRSVSAHAYPRRYDHAAP